MTERERWTVYPLLFLSLLVGLRSKVTSSLELNEIACHSLKSREVQIVGADDNVRLVLTALPPGAGGGGAMQILSGEGKPEVVLRALPHGGLVELASAKGILQVVLAVAPPGGFVETLDNHGKVVRTLAVALDPRILGKFGPPPAPAANESATEPAAESEGETSGEKTDPASETPASSDAPAGETLPSAPDEPTNKPANP